MNKFHLIAPTLLMGALTMSAATYSGSCGENAVWTLDAHTLHITGTGATTDYISPGNINATYPEWNDYKEDIKSVIIDEGITSLGSFSFYGYDSLESVSLPEGLIRIGNFAFYNCWSLAEVKFPSTLEYIGDKLLNYNNNGYVFYGCSALKSVTLPEGLKVVAGGSFNECDELGKVIWNAADCDADVMDPVNRYVGIFMGSPVNEVTFGPKVKSIPAKTFCNIYGLSKIKTPGTISFVGYEAFKGTIWENESKELAKVLYIDLAAYLFDSVFEKNNPYIQNYAIDIKPGTKCITDHLFEGTAYLEEVTIPASVEKIGNSTFKNCTGLKTVNWNATSILNDDSDYVAKRMFTKAYNVNLEEFNIGNSVVSLPGYLLVECDQIKEVILPESLRSIGEDVFYGCNALTSINVPDGVETLGKWVISNCSNLEKVTIGEGLKEFNYNSFLSGCPKLTTLEWNAIRPNEKVFDGYHATDVCSAPIEHFILGDKVEYVPGQLFWNSKTLKDVTFGKSVKVIGEAAFRGCSALSSVNLPQSLDIIGSYAFCETPLESVIIPEKVTKLGTWAFGSARQLTTVICTPLSAPTITSSFNTHNENIRIYVTDEESYTDGSWAEYKLLVSPIMTASTYTLTDEEVTPTFSLNIPGYTIVSMDSFTPDTSDGEHLAMLNMSCEGPQGNFSVIVPYRYTYKSDKDPVSVSNVNVDDNRYVEVYTLTGVKVFQGRQANINTSLARGIYIMHTSEGCYKIKVN